MKISIGSRTDIGGRTNNEDCMAILEREPDSIRADAVIVIADGMGGRANGEEASGVAVKLIDETVTELLDSHSEQPLPPAEDILAAGMRRANSAVYGLSTENPDTPKMGTTCIAALISDGLVTLAHVGDSRVYLVQEDSISPLTVDHTYVAEQVLAGNLTAEAARVSRFRNVITRAIGIAPTVQPDFKTFSLCDGDTVLFCTDGLTNTLDDDEILEFVNKSETAQGCANSLVEAAKAGGVRDNTTVIAVRASADAAAAKPKRGPVRSNGSKPTNDPTHKSVPELAESGQSEPTEMLRDPIRIEPEPSSGFRLIAIAVCSAILGAVATAGALYEIGWLRSVQKPKIVAPAVAAPQPSLPTSAMLLTEKYTLPAEVYAKPVAQNFLVYSKGSILVCTPGSGTIIDVNPGGQIINTLSQVSAPQEVNETGRYFALDGEGDLYISHPVSGKIVQQSLSGGTSRAIATGLNNLGAISATESGDVYFVENGLLEVIHPIFPGKQ